MKKAYTCPKCGEVILSNRCPKCGYELLPETPGPTTIEEEREKKPGPKKKGKRLASDRYLK